MMLRNQAVFISVWVLGCAWQSATAQTYNWLSGYDSANAIENRIPVPNGFRRIEVPQGSCADWIRKIPISKNATSVYRYDGSIAREHNAHFAVLDIDIGYKNLMQCADALIRLRAEYLYSKNLFDSISFNFTSGDTANYADWKKGYRPAVEANNVRWVKLAEMDSSYSGFREYLDSVFMYAGTHSLAKEMKKVSGIDSALIGDAFILGGFPGHAVMIADICVDTNSGNRLYLFIQGYTPAQNIHIIKNDKRSDSLPWFEFTPGDTLEIIHWKFTEENLRQF